MRLILLILFLIPVSVSQLHSQKEILRLADTYFSNQIYQKAVKYYLSAGKEANEEDVQYKLAVCYYELNDLTKAKQLFQKLYDNRYNKREVNYYLAKISHNEWEFENAISQYKTYLRKLPKDHKDRKMIIGLIKRSANGLKLAYQPQKSFIENMGPVINSPMDEFRVIQSKNFPEKYYLSSNRDGSTGGKRNKEGLKDEEYGKCNTDMYVVEGKEGIWGEVMPLSALINSSQHDVLQGFNEDGSVMFFTKGFDYKTSNILVDTFRTERTASDFPNEFLAKIKGGLGDSHLNIYNDSTILFSSKREGGYGGYDIYVTQQREGRWTEPHNLGPSINTAYDEISPFLANDGRSLFFSSNNEKSIGGFDVFRSLFLPEQFAWEKAENIGMPVNSGSDDTEYVITQGGKTALFSSDRKEGYGGKDIYISYLKEVENAQLSNALSEVLFIPTDIKTDTVNETIIANTELPNDEIVGPPVKVRDYLIKPLYYGDDEILLTSENKRQLNSIVEMLQIYPPIKIELACNTAEEGINAYELYFSIKRAEKVVGYLRKNGVDLNRIYVKGLGNNYPIAKEIKSGGNLKISQKNNRRIDIIVHNADGLPLVLNEDYQDIPDDFQDYKFEDYKSAIKGLSYKVQIAKVNQLYQNEILNNYDDATIEKDLINNSYLYTLGLYNRYNTARVLQDELVNGQFKNATVVPYINGIRIDKSAVENYISSYPDLAKFKAGEIQTNE